MRLSPSERARYERERPGETAMIRKVIEGQGRYVANVRGFRDSLTMAHRFGWVPLWGTRLWRWAASYRIVTEEAHLELMGTLYELRDRIDDREFFREIEADTRREVDRVWPMPRPVRLPSDRE